MRIKERNFSGLKHGWGLLPFNTDFYEVEGVRGLLPEGVELAETVWCYTGVFVFEVSFTGSQKRFLQFVCCE